MPNTADMAKKVILSHKLKRHIDLNTDFGQSRDDVFFQGEGLQLLSHMSSVNIPCCVHDGDPKTVLKAIQTAKQYQCSIGAHVGYPDPVNSGYQAMRIDLEDLRAWLYIQIGGFQALMRANGLEIEHVRPHGALYSAFIDNEPVARLVAETLYKINPWMMLVGPAGSILSQLQEQVGIRTAPEILLGRRYGNDGRLLLNRFHQELPPQGIVDQARQLIRESSLTSAEGQTIPVKFQALHLSPTFPNVVSLAEKISAALIQPVALSVAAVAESGWLDGDFN